MEALFHYMKDGGTLAQGKLSLEDYDLARRTGMSVAGIVNARYSDADPRYGTAFQQGQRSLGIFTEADPLRGIRATTVGELLDGSATTRLAGETLARGGNIVAAPTISSSTPSTRVFAMETILQVMQATLFASNTVEQGIWNRMVSGTDMIDGDLFIQPKIDVSAPRGIDGAPIAQNALPKQMVSISTSEVSRTIGNESIGLQLTDQALRNTTIDLVGTIVSQQAEGALYRKLWRDITAVVAGNVDVGTSALPVTAVTTFDSASTGGTLTQKAWLKMLWDQGRTRNLDSMICSLDSYLAVQNRTNRPLMFDPRTAVPSTGNAGNYGLDVDPNLSNWTVGIPNAMIVPDGTIPADYLLMFDSRYALRRARNIRADYAAAEQLVLQRLTAMRFDFGEILYRLRDEAFLVVDLTP